MTESSPLTETPKAALEFIGETMDFAECLDAMLSEKKVRRLEWPEKHYLTIAEEKVMIYKPEDDKLHPLIVSRGDLLGTDWVVVNQGN